MLSNPLPKSVKYFLALTVIALLVYSYIILFDLLVIVILSTLIALIFNPWVNYLEQKGITRLLATLLIFSGISVLIYFILLVIIPKFIYQVNQLSTLAKDYSIHTQISSFESTIRRLLPFFAEGELTTRFEKIITQSIINFFNQITLLLSSIFSIIAVIIIVPFITFFMIKDSKRIFQSLLHIMPNKYFEMSYWILKRVSVQLGNFVRGWIFDAAFVGVSLGFGFYLIGIENALPLGVLAGLSHLIPYFGPIIAGGTAMIISLIQFGNASHFPLIVLLIMAVYAIDNGIFQPYIFSKSIDIHPIAIILLIMAGGHFLGVIGLLLAIPIATIIKTASTEIYFAFKNYKIARM